MDKVAAARLLPCAERRAASLLSRIAAGRVTRAALHAAAAQAKQFREEHKAPLALLRQKVRPRPQH